MKVYTDLHNRTKMYNIPLWGIEELKKIGLEVVTEYSEDIEIFWGDLLTKKDVLNLPKLKWIHFSCVGINRALIPEVTNREFILTNSSDIFTDAVSSMVMSYIFYFSRGLNFIDRLRTNKNLNRESFDNYIDCLKEMRETKCLILGVGNVGSKLKSMLEALDIGVIGIKRNNYDDLLKNIGQADFVVNLLPLTDKTKYMFDYQMFRKMKNDAYFINAGRGKTVVQKDLIKALRNKIILGCALDVFDTEPLPKNSDLWNLDNVLITPHIANVSKNYWKNQIELFISNVTKYKVGKPLHNTVDLKKYK